MKSNNFREQVALVTSWFKEWNECEQTVALYSLLKKSSPVQAKFLDQVLQQSLADCTDVKQLEAKANDEAYVRSLYNGEKELVIHQLLQLLPLLQVGKSSVKKAYLQLIPELLTHTIQNGVNIEESRQLLSYSLIHPAITAEERSNFQTWLCCLEERFTYGSGSSTTTTSSNLSVGHSHSHSPSPGSSSQHSLTHLSPDLSVSQECINIISTNQGMSHITTSHGHSSPSPIIVSSHGHSSPSPIIGSGAHNSWHHLHQGQGHYTNFDASAAISPATLNGDNSGCAQFGPTSNGHLTLRATNSHAGAFGASHGHMQLHATSSAPPNFNSMLNPGPNSQIQINNHNSHAPLRRTHSITPPAKSQNAEKTVTDWLKTNHGHHPSHPILASRPQYVDHAPLSPQSSVTSSGSGGSDSHQDDGPQPSRDSFLEDGSGMREVPVWLKTLRLHKYAYLFRQMTYEEMLSVTEDWLEQQHVTKGARHKIYISIEKLRERQGVLRSLEKNVVDEGGSIKSALGEMKAMLNTPIKSYNPSQSIMASSINNPAYRTSASTLSTSPQSPSADEVIEGDLPAQFCRLMGKVCTQLLVASRPDDECFQIYLQLIDKCLNHEAFSSRQKKLLFSWKQSAQKIWQPPPQKYGERPRNRSFVNTFPIGASLGGRIIQRAGRVPVPALSPYHPGGIQQWSFGSKRSIVGGGCTGGTSDGHMPVIRNSSLNTGFLNKPGLLEQTKQPLSRTQSAPIHRPLTMPLQGCDANDTEINARLDSLCISMTEHALGSSDANDRASGY
ncbi:unnamed protein product [Lymnaea stagnalis]|uniref:SAM domain-containing protein n=1 Tax=Lymnaea stagnalis TaxID=6523 RepID=A0AAV2H3M5_LYMST